MKLTNFFKISNKEKNNDTECAIKSNQLETFKSYTSNLSQSASSNDLSKIKDFEKKSKVSQNKHKDELPDGNIEKDKVEFKKVPTLDKLDNSKYFKNDKSCKNDDLSTRMSMSEVAKRHSKKRKSELENNKSLSKKKKKVNNDGEIKFNENLLKNFLRKKI